MMQESQVYGSYHLIIVEIYATYNLTSAQIKTKINKDFHSILAHQQRKVSILSVVNLRINAAPNGVQ